jgi:radical SAM protein with 4Fe4S-binding SPASM domain
VTTKTAITRTRLEPWGAWVKLSSPPALVAVDQEGARALGLDGSDSLWQHNTHHVSRPLEVHVAVTSRCAAGCEGCYLDAKPDGIEPPREEIEQTFDALAEAGVFTIAFGGGEPTLRDDLGVLADAARARGLTPVVTTSGLGVGEKKLAQLARFAQVNVSYDGPSDQYRAVRGFDGSRAAEDTIRRLSQKGVVVGVNVVLTRATFDSIKSTLRRAFELGAREAQLLRYKPAGRATTTSLDYLDRRLSLLQAKRLGPLLRELAADLPELRIRIDCALVPFLSADESIASRPELLARWGVFGCEAGASLAATKVDGTIMGCSFATPTKTHARDLNTDAWEKDDALNAFRDFPARPPEPCASCTLRSVCRGGCKIVSQFVAGTVRASDPECPRVIEHLRQ